MLEHKKKKEKRRARKKGGREGEEEKERRVPRGAGKGVKQARKRRAIDLQTVDVIPVAGR